MPKTLGKFSIRKTFMGARMLFYDGRRPQNLLEGFQIAIAKWKIMQKNPGILCGGTRTCGLCLLFFAHGICFNCPIVKKTGQRGCMGFVEYGIYCLWPTAEHAQAVVDRLKEWEKECLENLEREEFS